MQAFKGLFHLMTLQGRGMEDKSDIYTVISYAWYSIYLCRSRVIYSGIRQARRTRSNVGAAYY